MPFNCFVVGDRNLYNTIHDRDFLEPLWNKHGPSNTPFRWTCCRTKVYWREGSYRPHVKHPPNSSSCPLDRAKGDTEQHERIQLALVHMGYSFGEQDAKPEYRELNGRCHFDVAWPKAGIAWEVDLTINTAREQFRRREIRARSGFEMISIRDAKGIRRSPALEVPTIWVTHLTKTGTPEGYPLTRAFVCGLYEPSQKHRIAAWQYRQSVNFETFAKERIAGGLVYRGHLGRSAPNGSVTAFALHVPCQRIPQDDALVDAFSMLARRSWSLTSRS